MMFGVTPSLNWGLEPAEKATPAAAAHRNMYLRAKLGGGVGADATDAPDMP